jgi:hypothetical protein
LTCPYSKGGGSDYPRKPLLFTRIHVLRPTRQENRRDAYSTFARDRSKERRHFTCATLRADTLTPNISIPSARANHQECYFLVS